MAPCALLSWQLNACQTCLTLSEVRSFHRHRRAGRRRRRGGGGDRGREGRSRCGFPCIRHNNLGEHWRRTFGSGTRRLAGWVGGKGDWCAILNFRFQPGRGHVFSASSTHSRGSALFRRDGRCWASCADALRLWCVWFRHLSGCALSMDVPQHGCLDIRAGEDDAADASAEADGNVRAMEDEKMTLPPNTVARPSFGRDSLLVFEDVAAELCRVARPSSGGARGRCRSRGKN